MTPNARYFSRLDLACEESAVRYARGHAKTVLHSWGLPQELTFDALTIVAELTSNAVRHAGADTHPFDLSGGQPRVPTCALALWISSGHLCISMSDESPELPVLRPASASSETGRGLQLIAGLSEGAWGFEMSHAQAGKIVWAWLRLPTRQPKARTPRGEGAAGSAAPGPIVATTAPEAWTRAVSA